jgi:hypothetical protein
LGRTTPVERARGARIVLVGLAVAVAVTLLVAQHLKNDPPLINGSSDVWHPAGAPFERQRETASFSFVPGYHDRLTVAIVAAQTGKVVKAFPSFTFGRHEYRTPTFRWNGRTAGGALAPAGRYEVRVSFAALHRTTIDPSISFTIK